MSKSYRAGNGRFVRQDNPVAVIGRLREQREQQRAEASAHYAAMRRGDARRRGYMGPLTRDDVAALVPAQRTGA